MTFFAAFRARLQTRFTSARLLGAIISLVAVGLTLVMQWPPGRSSQLVTDEWLRDRFINMQLRDEIDQRILVVDIDEATLAAYPWPWPRARIAELIERLMEWQPRGVALDIVMFKPGEPEGDARLAMLAQHAPLVMAQLFDYNPDGRALRSGELIGGAPGAAPGAPAATGYLANHAGLAQARHAGNIGVIHDADGALRRIPMLTGFEGRLYPTLTMALMQCCAGPAPATPPVMRVPFTRSLDAFEGASAAEILNGKLPPDLAAGRLILIGSTALSVGDRVSSPLGASTAGLLVHAEMLSSLLDMQAGTAPAPWPGRLLAAGFALLVTAAGAYTLPRLSAASNALMLLGAAALWLALAYFTAPHDPDFSPSGPLFSCLFLLAVAVPFHWQLAQHKSRRLLGTLRQYVATTVVDELLRRDLKDPLAPRQLLVTTLIADMEGYTSQVESLPIEQAARLTTQFLDCLTRPVLARQGTLDKYTGDGLVAFWGAPLPVEHHADLALDAAAAILDEVARFSSSWEAEGHAPLRVRIGIESGLAMAGDYGTALRSIYTAVGDSVNTASRLEQAARDYPHDVIIGPGTVQAATRHRFIGLGERRLRGKENPIPLYTLERAG